MFTSPIDTSALDNGAVSTSAVANPNDPAAMQDRFLKLLVAQLNNQDPMNPLDNAQMTSQMAQINTVTGLQTLNLTMQGMAEQFATMQTLQGITMIGRSVLCEGNRLHFDEPAEKSGATDKAESTPKTAKGYFDLSSAATHVTAEILSPAGQIIDTVELGALDRGRGEFAWDASQYTGGNPAELRFRITASGADAAADEITATPLMRTKVVATGSQAGALTLTLADGSIINYANVRGVV